MAKAKDQAKALNKEKKEKKAQELAAVGESEATGLVRLAFTNVCFMACAWSLPRALPFLVGSDGQCYFAVRLVFWAIFDATFSATCHKLVLQPARVLARCIPGAASHMASDEAGLAAEESLQHDATLVWPPPDAPIPAEWRQLAAKPPKPTKQPYFLNHVRGHVRFRQAMLRLGSATGTLLQTAAMGAFFDGTELIDTMLLRGASWGDLGQGVATGACCIVVVFAAEIAVGWLRVIGYLEVVAPGEWLVLNLFFDVLFHVSVAINEELTLRGWLLLNTSKAAALGLGLNAYGATAVAIGVQSLLFAAAHAASPGASAVGLLNLSVGGIAGALNVVLTGNLAFALGWHFGWNIVMGHLLGLSTSGIPMSAKLVSVVPHPAKAPLHGGTFGPEQSPLAPAAYMLGVGILVAIYGTDGWAAWENRVMGTSFESSI